MNNQKQLALVALFGLSALTVGCGQQSNDGGKETVVIEREVVREEPKGDSFSLSIGDDGNSVNIRAEDQ